MGKQLETKRHTLGLALSGGGVRGFAHLGAFKAMEEFGLLPDIISGTSAGALAGLFYADGYSPEEILSLFAGRELKKFIELHIPRSGIFSTIGLRNFLKKHIRAKCFEDLNIPLQVVATDLDNGVSVIFDKGEIIDAVIASCSIPIIFDPVIINGINYVDGGLFKNFPVSNIRAQCNKIIGINVSPLLQKKYNKSIIHIAERSYHYMFRANTLLDRKLCDILVETKEVGSFKTYELHNATELFQIGYQITQEAILEGAEKKVFDVLCSTENGEKKILLP
ncbi:phospholipase [Bacteroidales bacterium]|nr:phospholipase [Bacteroidales bacterium]